MARKPTTEGSDTAFVAAHERQHMKAEFKKRVHRAMTKKEWNQSDLGRHSGLGKDSISKYLSEQTVPSRSSIEKLARALNVTANDLWPNYDGSASKQAFTQQRTERDPADPQYAFLYVNVRIRYDVAVAINKILDAEISNAANAV